MFTKKLLIVGVFGLLAMAEAKAEWQQTPVTANTGGKIELVKWCDGRRDHPRCRHHRHHHWQPGPFWYDKSYQSKWGHCHGYNHRGRPECRRFCFRNPGTCY